jgi:hypothetical protein
MIFEEAEDFQREKDESKISEKFRQKDQEWNAHFALT